MKKKLIALLLLGALVFCLFTGCVEEKSIDQAKAQLIALEDMGVSPTEASIHVHTGTSGDTPCYLVFVTYEGETMAYTISAEDGAILHKEASDHAH